MLNNKKRGGLTAPFLFILDPVIGSLLISFHFHCLFCQQQKQ